MADKKDKKKKKKEDADTSTEPEAPASTPVSSTRKSGGSSKKAKRAGSNVFDQFSQRQVAEFKEGFQFMDHDKDGIIGKSDIRATCDEVGRLTSDEEIESMLNDVPSPINFTMLINIIRTALMTWGEKYTAQEVDDFFDQIDIDDNGKISCSQCIEMLTGKAAEE
ncbi:Myosin regulatory light chain 2 [Armadillidium nasatum]|uniref:Myosin regulatory light chain 2 n=1 Tax=Armadillidium nasatum TaxID=96803 RepID=A0A5N5STL2_9CRUS|nr:Myosin regulatory light chain 2 [Armadillidium nasatum]